MTALENIKFIETTVEIDILAVAVMKQFNLKSIFDAYYATTTLHSAPDHTIISTDDTFDKITGIKRVAPRSL
ncbi:hypothetical protein KEJ51_02085 [Candidatus Bathyarchaeota archaeon]|nr:hypothetical protein [Candidatus Bathyarchaeota archaeon]MBS7628370.1 hypothetical protein [Candidatus Bathyarchaeota archaeon]